MHRTAEEPQRRVLDDMLVLERDEQLLHARRLQARGVDRDEHGGGLVEDEVVRDFRRELKADVRAKLDNERVTERAHDDI